MVAHAIAVPTLMVSLSRCSAFNYAAPDSPVPEVSVAPVTPAPRVALVPGSGGPRGYAHIGIMKVLEEAGIDYDLVVGSSAGALIGAFWANGFDAEEIDRFAQSGGPFTLFDLSFFADRGWIRGQRLQDYVNKRLGGKSIEQMPRRLIVAATRRDDKAPVFFRSGNIGVAVRASSAVPRIISPVGINGTEFEDADESLPVAVRAARQASAAGYVEGASGVRCTPSQSHRSGACRRRFPDSSGPGICRGTPTHLFRECAGHGRTERP